jgi:undecaprenyl-diphosphatase
MLEWLIKFWDKLVALDKDIFILINSRFTNALFDKILVLFRTPVFWTPLYLALLVTAVIKLKKKAIWWILSLTATAGIMDWTGNNLIKHTVQRLRPCNDPAFADQVRLVVSKCGTGFSFISNHAANHFAVAAFIFVTMPNLLGKWTWLFFIWAASIAYAQVYVGVHYPSDVLGGALTGLIFGWTGGTIYNKKSQISTFAANNNR